MKKNIIRLNEAQLRGIIKESVRKILAEAYVYKYKKTIDGEKFLDSFVPDEDFDRLYRNDNIADIYEHKFVITSDNNKIIDDEGLKDLIEDIMDPEIKEMALRKYEEETNSNDGWEEEAEGDEDFQPSIQTEPWD